MLLSHLWHFRIMVLIIWGWCRKIYMSTFKLTIYSIYENWSPSIGLTMSESFVRKNACYKGPFMFTKLRSSTSCILQGISSLDIATRLINYDCIINHSTIQWLRKVSISFSHLHVCESGGIALPQVDLDPPCALGPDLFYMSLIFFRT